MNEKEAHLKLSEIQIDNDNLDYVKATGEICGKLRYDLVKLFTFTGLNDKNEKELFADDLIKSNNGDVFRIYSVPGGFAIKATPWAKDKRDFVRTDLLIMEPLADAQTASFIHQSCEKIGNIHDANEIAKA